MKRKILKLVKSETLNIKGKFVKKAGDSFKEMMVNSSLITKLF